MMTLYQTPEVSIPVGVKKVDSKGLGLFARKSFRRGELITHCRGRVTKRRTKYSIQFGWNQHLEPDVPYRCFNHSCKPNAYLKLDLGLPTFYALVSIKKGEEITVDYDTFEYETHFMKEKICCCGAVKCRKKIRGWRYLPIKLKTKLQPYTMDYLRSKRRNIYTSNALHFQ